LPVPGCISDRGRPAIHDPIKRVGLDRLGDEIIDAGREAVLALATSAFAVNAMIGTWRE
jgi:hypothetical protein